VTSKLLIKNANFINADGSHFGHILIENGKISEITDDFPNAKGYKIIDASGMLIFPGLVDPHVHFTSPDLADTFEECTINAALGGVTTFIDFLYLREAKSYSESFYNYINVRCAESAIDYSFHLTLTDFNDEIRDELPIMYEKGVRSVKIYTTFRTSDKFPDKYYSDLIESLKQHGYILVLHAEDDEIIAELEKKYTGEGKTGLQYLQETRPPEAEASKILEIGNLTRKHELPLYIVHLTSELAMNAVEKLRKDGAIAYVETLPRYLTLTNDYISQDEIIEKLVIPPLRSKQDVDTLRDAIFNQKIQTVATDHYGKSIKQKKMSKSINDWICGLSVSEIYLPLMHQIGVRELSLPLENIVSLMSTNPAKIFGFYPKKGIIAPGSDGDLVIFDPEKEVKISHKNLNTKVGFCPYEGYEVKGWSVMTILRVEIISSNGKFTGHLGSGEFVIQGDNRAGSTK
jgi:dihydropyrimidinase